MDYSNVFITLTIILLLVFLTSLYNKKCNYWKQKGVTSVNHFGYGSFSQNILLTNSCGNIFKSVYDKHPDKRYLGFYYYFQPILLIRDPKLIQKICVSDFDSFIDRTPFLPLNVDSLWAKNMVAQSKDAWHHLRRIVSPLFTGRKLRMLFPIIQHCTNDFINDLNMQLKEGKATTVDLRHAFTRVSSDVIANVVFGFTPDSRKNRVNEISQQVQQGISIDGFTGINQTIYYLCPILIKILNIKVYSEKLRQFFNGLVKDTLKLRIENKIIGHNLVQLFEEVINTDSQYNIEKHAKVQMFKPSPSFKNSKLKLTEEDITANSLIFFFGAFETIRNTLSYIVYELTVHQDEQQKVYQEIQEVLKNNNKNVTYDLLNTMKYLDNVISESLRLHPPSAILDRKSEKPYVIEPELLWEKPLYLEKNTWIWIMHRAIHYDKKYFTNPETFDPDRFNNENIQNIKPFTYMPFGIGQRSCIASRLGLLEIKLIVAELIRNYEFVEIEETKTVQNYDPRKINPLHELGIKIGLKSRF